jgi:hypothetical protein
MWRAETGCRTGPDASDSAEPETNVGSDRADSKGECNYFDSHFINWRLREEQLQCGIKPSTIYRKRVGEITYPKPYLSSFTI